MCVCVCVFTHRLLVAVEDVFLGEQPHAVHQAHLTVALLGTNTVAATLQTRTGTPAHNHADIHRQHRSQGQHRDQNRMDGETVCC